jgi:hypothetical protein
MQSNLRIFEKADLFVNISDPELAYRRRKDEEKKTIHWGQRKLLLSLVQFLTLFWNPKKVSNPKIVYAGAAPGTNIGIVSMLFPEVEFHLYDPAPFKIEPNERIHLYQQYFTDADAKKWANRSDIYFISDIRTADYTKAKDLDENENQIMKDMEMQMVWFNIIDPVEGQLKFRPPYTGGNRPDRIEYFYGYVFKQPWAPQTTTETRLVPVRNDSKKWFIASWSAQKYQDQMFHHNVMVRESYRYENPFTKDEKFIDSPELLNDWDSLTETQIWLDYLQKRTGIADKTAIIALSRLITDKLSDGSKHKDTLYLLRSNPQFIKQRNFKPSRDNMAQTWHPLQTHIQPELQPNIKSSRIETNIDHNRIESKLDNESKIPNRKLASDIGL